MAKKTTTAKDLETTAASGTPAHEPSRVQQAAAIVAHIMVHFGAGYGSQRQGEDPNAPPPNLEIFARPSDMAGFHLLLLDSTLRNFDDIDFRINKPLRDQVCKAAFAHGVQARKLVAADGSTTLRLHQILTTLVAIQEAMCPAPQGSAGGGGICDF